MATLTELAAMVKGSIAGDEACKITGVAGVEDVKQGQITMAASARVIEEAVMSPAAAVIVPFINPQMEGLIHNLEKRAPMKPLLQVANPRLAFAQILHFFYPDRACRPGVAPSAVIGRDFRGSACEIGPLVYIGDDVQIGPGTIIFPGAVIGDRVRIGAETIIHANVVIREDCVIGNKVQIHAGTVIGSDGFGYVTVDGEHYKVPQIGKVVIEDEVEIGSNVSIDRATTEATLIKRGTKIDNLVQIAHNCELGANNMICGQAAIAGSTKLGDRVTMAGRAGAIGHLKIGNDTVIAACSTSIGNLPPYSFVSGTPARPHAEDMRIQAAAGRLPELLKEFRELQKKVVELEGKINQ